MNRITPLATASLITATALGPVFVFARWLELYYLDAVTGAVKMLTYGPFLLVSTALLLGLVAGIWIAVFVATERLIETVNSLVA